MSKMHSTSLLSTPWPFWTGILSQVSKNDGEKTLLLRVIWLYVIPNKKIIDLPCLDPLGVLRLLVLRKNLIWGFGGRDKGLCWALVCRFGLFICLNVDPDDTTSLEAPEHPEPRPVTSAFSSIKGSFELVFKYWKNNNKQLDSIKILFLYWKHQ